MIPLPATFRSDHFDFKLLKRSGNIALFEKSKPNHANPCYEVVIIQKAKEETIMGKEYPEREKMPRSEDWGTYGGSYIEYESAKRKFRLLEDAQEHVNSPNGTENGEVLS